MKLGVALLAAGRSSRFGANKLLAEFAGRPMVCRALDAVRMLGAQRVIVIAGCGEVARLARTYGYDVVMNDAQELGQAHSICLGIAVLREMDAALLMVADQPRLTAQSLAALLNAYERGGKGIACLKDETHMGNPAVFARTYFDELTALSGDRGAKGILRAHAGDVLAVSCLHAGELADADTPQALEQMRGK